MLAVVVASGGLDSCVTAAVAAQTHDLAMLHVMYGQRTEIRELKAFRDIALLLKAKRTLVIRMDHLKKIGGSSLTDIKMPIPETGVDNSVIPSTYVPFRNANLLSAATSWAEVIGAVKVLIGVNALDSSGYPDCRPKFIEAFNKAIQYGTKPDTKIHIETPLLHLKKHEIVRLGIEVAAPLQLSWSCYQSIDRACGVCDSCRLRIRGFREAGIPDPIEYAVPIEW